MCIFETGERGRPFVRQADAFSRPPPLTLACRGATVSAVSAIQPGAQRATEQAPPGLDPSDASEHAPHVRNRQDLPHPAE
jgi:hypothetical protein